MIERKRPIKQYRVTQAFGPYIKGALIQPTGMYRDVLLKRGQIEEVVEDRLADRAVVPEVNRMVTMPARAEPARETLTLRKRK